MNKKGQQISLGNGSYLVIALLLTILVAALGSVALTTIRDTTDLTATGTRADSNTVTALVATNVFFGDNDVYANPPVSCTAYQFFNGTNAVNATTNVTVGGAGNCYITNITSQYNNSAIQANYTLTFTTYDYGYNITINGNAGTLNYSAQTPTIGTMLGVGLIIAVIVGAFAMVMRGKQE